MTELSFLPTNESIIPSKAKIGGQIDFYKLEIHITVRMKLLFCEELSEISILDVCQSMYLFPRGYTIEHILFVKDQSKNIYLIGDKSSIWLSFVPLKVVGAPLKSA